MKNKLPLVKKRGTYLRAGGLALAILLGSFFIYQTQIKQVIKAQFIREYVFTPLGNPNPFSLNFVAAYRFVAQVGEFLVRRDINQQIIPGLARDWSISSDRKSIVFYIRKEIYTAEEVAQSLRRIVQHGQTSHSNFASQVKEIRVLSSEKLEIVTINDAAAVLSPLVMADAVILPNDHWVQDSQGNEIVDWRKSKGPYIWDSGNFPAEPGNNIRFVPNAQHYRFEAEQVGWEIIPKNLSELTTMEALTQLLNEVPSYATLRNSALFKFLSDTSTPPPLFFETKLNGIAYLQLNQHSDVFSSLENRKEALKRLFFAEIKLQDPSRRAFQIPQPGLTGRTPNEQIEEFKLALRNSPPVTLPRPIVVSIPQKPEEDTQWHLNAIKETGLEFTAGPGSVFPFQPTWKNGEVDAIFLAVGMSDTDPISSASFLFSPKSGGADLPNGQILEILNSAKGTTNPSEVSVAIRKAFFTALENATIVPLYYISNRHYHSKCTSLNISDPYAEQVDIRNVRINANPC